MEADTAFIKQRSEQLYRTERAHLTRLTNRMFAALLVLQWLAGHRDGGLVFTRTTWRPVSPACGSNC